MLCPKCGNKIKKDMSECPFCGTTSQNILMASNKQAKELIKQKQDISKIVMSNTVPNDVNKTKLLLFSIFFGWLGIHCFYVGRMKRGFTIPLLFLFCICFVCIPESWFLHSILSGITAGMLGCVACFCWWLDICRIVGGRFKIPVILNNYL